MDLILLALWAISVGFGILAIMQWTARGESVPHQLGIAVDRNTPRDALVGLAIGTAGMAGIFAVEAMLGFIRVDAFALHAAPLTHGVDALLLNAAVEEVVMRSFLLGGLLIAFKGRAWPAIVLGSITFGLIHLGNQGASLLSALGNGLGGLVYGLAFVKARNIWLPLGIHFAWNFMQGPVFGFAVSGLVMPGLFSQHAVGPEVMTGGGYGPEAGLVGIGFRFVMLAGVFAYSRAIGPRPAPRRALAF